MARIASRRYHKVPPTPGCPLAKHANSQVALSSVLSRKGSQMKIYTKPVLIKLGNIAAIKSNASGPSVDGSKYAGYFK